MVDLAVTTATFSLYLLLIASVLWLWHSEQGPSQTF